MLARAARAGRAGTGWAAVQYVQRRACTTTTTTTTTHSGSASSAAPSSSASPSVSATSTSTPAPSSETLSASQPQPHPPSDGPPPPVSRRAKVQFFVASMVPMIGFGMMDNTIMILAGDLIDNFFGSYLKFTLVAAAFGQLFSDVSGVLFGGTVEAIAYKCGIREPPLTEAQRRTRSIRTLGTLAAAVGVVIGCLLGMVNLLFMDLEKADRMKRAEKLRTLFDAIISEGWELVNCDRCTLYLLQDITETDSELREGELPSTLFTMVRHGVYPSEDQLVTAFKEITGYDPKEVPKVQTQQLAQVLTRLGWESNLVGDMLPDGDEISFEEYTRFITEHIVQEHCKVPLRAGGTKWHVLTTGDILNVKDVYADERFRHSRVLDKVSGYRSQSVLIGPVKDDMGRVIGLVEMTNKFKPHTLETEGGDETELQYGLEVTHFTEMDEKLLHLICGHCSTFIAHILKDEG